MAHGIENVIRIDNLMYKGCEPHWKCVKCGECVPFHCWSKEQFAQQNCNADGENTDCKADDIKSNITEEMATDDFGFILNCAVRYAIGRRSYAPSVVISYISPLLKYLDMRTIAAMKRDIEEASDLGDENIDKPDWLNFLSEINKEIERRN